MTRRCWALLALLCACAGPNGSGAPKRLLVDQGQGRRAPVTPALAGLDAPEPASSPARGAPAPKLEPAPRATPKIEPAAAAPARPASPPRSAASAEPKTAQQDLPALSSAKGGQIDQLLQNRLDVTAYRVQISKTKDFDKPLFDKTFDAMKPIDLYAEFQDAGVEVDQKAYWVRIALIDLLAHEEKFTAPRLYGLDKQRQDE